MSSIKDLYYGTTFWSSENTATKNYSNLQTKKLKIGKLLSKISETIKDVNHSEHEDMLEWVGGEFDPEEFDMKYINERLKEIS